jgi:hypothetical protein
MRLFIFLSVMVFAFSGCNECIDCSGVAGKPTNKLCKSTYNDGGSGISWDTYRAALKASGCK